MAIFTNVIKHYYITHQAKLSSISKCEAPNVISVVISFTDPLSVTLQIALEMQTIFMTPDLLAHQVGKVALELLMQRIRHDFSVHATKVYNL